MIKTILLKYKKQLMRICWLVIILANLIWPLSAQAVLIDDLQDGQHVLLMRHADAPGIGDPPGYVLSNCATQRNLGEYGIRQAKAIGHWLKDQGIKTARVYSSPWCRCKDTAQFINLGDIKQEPALGSFFDDMRLEKKATKDLENLIQNELKKNSNVPLVFVTHHVNIQAFTGKVVNVGDMLLVKVNKSGQYLSHVIYPSPNVMN